MLQIIDLHIFYSYFKNVYHLKTCGQYYYFSDSITYPDQKKFGCLLVMTDFQTTRLIKSRGPNKFKYFKDNKKTNRVLAWPYSRNDGRSIFLINHRINGTDTIDVNIGYWKIEEAKRNWLVFNVLDVSGIDYIPDGRFIIDKTTGGWLFITHEEMIAQKNKENMLRNE